jgi:hypothetical protein
MTMGLPGWRVALLVATFGATALSAERTGDAMRRMPLISSESCSDPAAGAAAPPSNGGAPVLVDGFGFAGIEADSRNAGARAFFAQGVRMIYAFDEAEAVRFFRAAQQLDPECALCFFGEAWARGPTINLQPRTDELPAARAAARHAAALAGHVSPRDRALIEAMNIRTADGPAFGNNAYADYVEAAAQLMPDDDTLSIMAADSRMILLKTHMQPGSLSQRLLERVLRRSPNHSGAIHYYIHLADWIGRRHLAEPYADRLGRLAPAASHLVHMPSHTFYWLGRYRDAAAVNLAALDADRRYEARARPPYSDYRSGLLRHDMQFAIESAIARGDGATALAISERYRAAFLGPGATAPARLLGSATYYAQGLYGDVDAVLAMAEPANAMERVFRHYARGEALARRGQAEAVRAEAAAIAVIRRGTDAPALGESGTPLASVLQSVLEGRAAMLAGNMRAAAEAYRAAMNAQLAAGWSFDPPLFWYSARRSLAAALLGAGDAAGARDQLNASLQHWPGDALALYALSLAERRLGHADEARRALARARDAWAGDVTAVPLARI